MHGQFEFSKVVFIWKSLKTGALGDQGAPSLVKRDVNYGKKCVAKVSLVAHYGSDSYSHMSPCQKGIKNILQHHQKDSTRQAKQFILNAIYAAEKTTTITKKKKNNN